MTKEQFKAYVCNQIDLMSEQEIQEFSNFLTTESKEENIAEELIVIKGEFKKLTKLVHSMEQKINNNKLIQNQERVKPFIAFDTFLRNSKDALFSLPKASMFNAKQVNRAMESLKNGFQSIDKEYEALLNQMDLMRVANIGDKFDSNLHEAVEVIEDKSKENGIIIEVLQEGFSYENTIINYAKVKVNQWTL